MVFALMGRGLLNGLHVSSHNKHIRHSTGLAAWSSVGGTTPLSLPLSLTHTDRHTHRHTHWEVVRCKTTEEASGELLP